MRLLVAEDERSLSKALTVILEKNKYSVDAAYDGEEALDYLSVGQYDGLILDIMMPKMDGITVLKKLRAKGNNIPVLMLTAKSEIDDRVTGLDCGANDYLTKPFDTKELLARIRAMTRGRSGAQSSVMTMGNISLDLLMSNPKQLIPTELMMEKIWGFDSDSEISVVWAYISYLRKKLTALNADIKIKASRNAGYSLEMVE